MISQVYKSFSALRGHPWLKTESDIKCALYTALYNRLCARIGNLSSCEWNIITEYPISNSAFIDFALFRNENLFLLIELKYIKKINEKEIQRVEDDFQKRRQYVIDNSVRFLQLIVSKENSQFKTELTTIMKEHFQGLYAPKLSKVGADISILYINY